MAKTIKGIKIEIDGSTTGLVKSLEDVNKKTGTLQSELRQVERALKFNPGNTTLIAQQQKLLAEQVETTSEKLNRLKKAQADVDKQFAEGKISEKAYREFQREIVETESKLKHFETQLASSQSKLKAFGDSAVETGEKMKNAGGKIKDVGKDLSTKVTAPLVGVAAIAAKVGSDFEASMSKVQAISGASGEDLVKLTEKARDMGATTQFSASEAADALSFMAMAGWKTNDMLSGIEGIMALAAASGEDLALTSDIVTDALTAFGMTAKDSGQFADVLAAASSNANTNVAMLGESFKYVAPVAGALKFSAEDTALALGLMANSGIKASNAGTALRSMMTNLTEVSVPVSKEMKRLGISLTDSEGNMKSFRTIMDDLRETYRDMTPDIQANSAAQLFGKEAMSGALAIINASEEDYTKLAEAINSSEGAAQQMAETMTDNLQGRMKEMQSALEEAAISIYNNLQPALESVVAFIQNLADWFNQLSPAAQNTIIALAGVAAAIGPMLVVLGTLVASLGAIFVAFGTVSGAIAVVTTGAAAASPAVGALAATFTALTGPIGIAVAAIAGIVAALVLAYNKVDWFRDGVNKIWEFIKTATKKAFDAVSKVIISIVQDVVKFVSAQLDKFKYFWDENGKFITAIVKKYFGYIADNIKVVMGVIKGIFETVWPIISGIVEIAWGVIKTIVGTSIDLVLGIIQTVMKVLQGDWEGAWTTIQQTAMKIVSGILKFFQDVDLLQIGKDMIQGLINGIGSMVGAVVERVKSLADLIPDGIKKVLGIKSPSRVLKQIGVWTIEGFINGMKEMQNVPISIMDEISDAMQKKMGYLFEEIRKVTNRHNDEMLSLTSRYDKRLTDNKEMHAREIQNLQYSLNNGILSGAVEFQEELEKVEKKYSAKSLEIQKELTDEKGKLQEIHANEMKDWQSSINQAEYYSYVAMKDLLEKRRQENKITALEEMRIWKEATLSFTEDSGARQGAILELESAHNRALESMKQRNEELRAQEASITAEYTKAVSERTKSIASFSGVLDEFKIKTEKSGEDLMSNLQSQVDGFKLWSDSIANLSSRAIDEGLLAELKGLGPKAAGELAALNKLTDAQLAEYSALYQEKQALAREQAEAELVGMKADTEQRIQDLRNTVQSELDEINAVWKAYSAQSVNDTNDEFKKLVDVGKQAGQNLLDGLASMENAVVNKAKSIASAVSGALSSITVPSINMNGLNANVPQAAYAGAGGSSSSTTINQTVNFNQPVESPADYARRQQQANRQLGLEWGLV